MPEAIQLSPSAYEVTNGADPLAEQVYIVTDADPMEMHRMPGETLNADFFDASASVRKAPLSEAVPVYESAPRREFTGVNIDAATLLDLIAALRKLGGEPADAPSLDEYEIPQVQEPLALEMGSTYTREKIDEHAERVRLFVDAYVRLAFLRSSLHAQRIGSFNFSRSGPEDTGSHQAAPYSYAV